LDSPLAGFARVKPSIEIAPFDRLLIFSVKRFPGYAGEAFEVEAKAAGFLRRAPEGEIFAPSLKLWKSVLLSSARRGCDNPATSRKGME
jgi:hypothetical protein